MMYLLKDHIGEAEDMLPVLDLFRCAYASGVDNKRWWNDFFENFNPPPFSRRLLKQPRGNLIWSDFSVGSTKIMPKYKKIYSPYPLNLREMYFNSNA